MAVFGYYINLDERGEFYADVRDASGETVLEIDGFDMFEDGYMNDKTDISGLNDYMIEFGMIGKDDEVLDSSDFEERISETSECVM